MKKIFWRYLTVTSFIFIFATFFNNQAFTSTQIPGKEEKQMIALFGATLHTVSNGTIENGTIIFAQGKIVAIGKDLPIPNEAKKIDISGKHVYPGFISLNSAIGLLEVGSIRATLDYQEVGEFNPNVRADIAFNPDSEIIPVTRANGITSSLSIPAGGLISGSSALMYLDGWTGEEMKILAPAGVHINWPDMELNIADEKELDKKKTKIAADLQKLNEIIISTKKYLEIAGKDKTKLNLKFEALIPVIKKQIPVFIHADRLKQIKSAISWSSAHDLKVIIIGGYDAWLVNDLLKEKDIPVIITDVQRLPLRKWESYDTPFLQPFKLWQSGIKFAIAGEGGNFGTPHERNLPYQAATAVTYGLPRDEAIRSITLSPAEILGVSERIGSLVVGKDATLIVTNGDPLEIATNVEKEFIMGKEVDLSSRHTLLYQKYLEKYKK